ncbi:hypothetical protein [Olleya sp. R77988]|uniref:hypothetical protein n=1 Tax=Olleya sp. R77988 TaxID=3093875 RepID=UPI0037CA2B63
MKTVNNLKEYLVLITLALFVTSCEQFELEEENSTPQNEQVEGFKGRTHDSDFPIDDVEVKEALFHMTYSGDISEEEANAKFNLDVKSFMKDYKKNSKGFSTEWFYFIATHTGNQSNNNTDDDVFVVTRFNTNKGKINSHRTLNNWGDDREKGDWDYYFFSTYYPNEAVSWVECDYVYIFLSGTDGWFITDLFVGVFPSFQSASSYGYSKIVAYPNVWLDNPSSDPCCDSYKSSSSFGRLTFD